MNLNNLITVYDCLTDLSGVTTVIALLLMNLRNKSFAKLRALNTKLGYMLRIIIFYIGGGVRSLCEQFLTRHLDNNRFTTPIFLTRITNDY